MQKNIILEVEKLPEGYYLVTSSDVQGLVAQGKTFEEAVEIAKDVASKILSNQIENNEEVVEREKIFYPTRITI
ncbi:MAG: hypothetical protein GF335_00150 [Candidatus Moranbacteria bacterium]|nr:hypothetical protein [Candidatus Moranbacteria bacterium]